MRLINCAFIAVLIFISLPSCVASNNGSSCSVVDNLDGTYTMTCPDGSQVIIKDGAAGTQGAGCTAVDNLDGTYTINCPDGTSVTLHDGNDAEPCTVEDGLDGSHTMTCGDGIDVTWSDGAEGLAGNSCTVADNLDGTYTMTCTDGTEVTFHDGTAGTDGDSCTVEDNLDGTYIMTCPDGSTVTLHDGKDGKSCTVEDNQDGSYTMTCGDESVVTWSDGTDGQAGTSCAVADNLDGTYTLSCSDGTTVILHDGSDGEDAESCVVLYNSDFTYTMTCPDGSSVTWGLPVAGMILIPEGPFWMGCDPAVDSDCYWDATPYHEVTLSRYRIDQSEVTKSAYRSCVTAGACSLPSTNSPYCNWAADDRDNHPVNCVTWAQAQEYCLWADKRLPTEAEWEKAARGADGRKYPWGSAEPTCQLAIMDEGASWGCGTSTTNEVCSRSPAGDSPYGLCDMAGNVLEWVSDWFVSDYYVNSPASNPTGPVTGTLRGVRGGCFSQQGSRFSTSARDGDNPASPGYYVGFRCVRGAND